MAIKIREDAIRQENNTVFFPEHFWTILGVEKGGKLKVGIDEGKHGVYIAAWKNGE